tara:strand:+ start:96 stop:278 length:183 start_codon:yes stop_codon:yes gene_type:complete
LIQYEYINYPAAIDVEVNIPEISIKAKRLPMKPPLSLSKLDLIRRTRRKKDKSLKGSNFN